MDVVLRWTTPSQSTPRNPPRPLGPSSSGFWRSICAAPSSLATQSPLHPRPHAMKRCPPTKTTFRVEATVGASSRTRSLRGRDRAQWTVE